jgi:thiaminase/transcriptional activator TenA
VSAPVGGSAAASTSGFAAELWEAGAPTYAQIVAHPFLAGLSAGTLPREAFAYFVAQDSHYLKVYARALALTAARATDPAAAQMFAAHAANAVAVEQDLHTRLLTELGLSGDDVASTPVGPTTLAYTSYLLAVCATGSYAEAVAAVLPCYWVYREVGRTLLARSSPDPAYATWIATYASPEFDAVVEAVVATADALGPATGPVERARCREHFATTTRYEWMFWDAAWTGLGWPV